MPNASSQSKDSVAKNAVPATAPQQLAPPLSSPNRLTSIDTYRGFVMFLMVAEIFHLSKLSDGHPDSLWRHLLKVHTSHVEWVGCSLHDMIQPSFSFLVGTAMAFSLAARVRAGSSLGRMALHAVWRSVVLVLLGVFLRSLQSPQTNWTFTDTLSQIGFGYFPLFLLALTPAAVQYGAIATILIGYWIAFVIYPLPPADFDYAAVNATSEHLFNGFQEHWNKNSNLAWAFDRWFLNLFPQTKPFEFQSGGYSTLSFVPTLATMLLGLRAGFLLRGEQTPARKVRWLLVAGAACLAAGWLLGAIGVCPVVKRIWTPAFALFSGGWCFLILGSLYAVIDVAQWRRWTYPLVVIGANSIAIYVMDWTMADFFYRAYDRHFGAILRGWFTEEVAVTLMRAGVVVTFWSILAWLYRRRVFIKI